VAYKKLTEEEKEEVVRLYVEEEKSIREISEIYGVSKSTVRQVLIDKGIPRRGGWKPLYKSGKACEEDALKWSPEREELFWVSVDKRRHDGCWLWMKSRNKRGYGQCSFGYNSFKAHRIAWILTHRKPIPPGLIVMHKCDTPPCCRPDHLQLGTNTQNSLDMVQKGRSVRGEKNWRARLSSEEVLRIRELHCSGVPVSVLANEFGVTEVTIYDIVTGKTWAFVGGPTVKRRSREELKGEEHPSAKLSGSTVVRIREKYRTGHSIPELANEFGLGRTTIHNIVTRRTWGHVGGPAPAGNK